MGWDLGGGEDHPLPASPGGEVGAKRRVRGGAQDGIAHLRRGPTPHPVVGPLFAAPTPMGEGDDSTQTECALGTTSSNGERARRAGPARVWIGSGAPWPVTCAETFSLTRSKPRLQRVLSATSLSPVLTPLACSEPSAV